MSPLYTCMAGQGECWSSFILEQTSCISKENTWIMQMAVKDIPYLKLEQIHFNTAEKKMKLCENATAPDTSSSHFVPPT